jgi:hypothetical protein
MFPAEHRGKAPMADESPRSLKGPSEPTRRAYERPAIAWQEDFEPYVFSTCGKMPGQGGACRVHRSS